MARDTDRNAYHTVGIPRDSAAYQRLMQEAMESNISVPSLIALRVADWYRLTASGTLALAAQGTSTSITSQGASKQQAEPDDHESQQAKVNALAAAETWLD